MKAFKTARVAAAVLAFGVVAAQPASAQTSQLNIVGTVNIFQVPAGPVGNVIIDFLPPNAGGNGVVNSFLANTGVFTTVPFFTPGTNIDFVFGPNSVPPTTNAPVTFLTIGGYTFTASSFGPGNISGQPFSLTQNGTAVFATLGVDGTVTGPGLIGPNPFSGGYSTQFPNTTVAAVIAAIEAGKTIGPSSISATFVVSAVPEPATLGLLATGLFALVGFARARRNEA